MCALDWYLPYRVLVRDLIFRGLVHLFSMPKIHDEKCNL